VDGSWIADVATNYVVLSSVERNRYSHAG